MKKVLLMCIISVLVLLAGCGVLNPSYTPGQWNGSVFTNEHFGFRMNIPDTWIQITDCELTEMGLDVAQVFSGIRAIEMSAIDMMDKGFILWMLEPAVRDLRNSTALDYLNVIASGQEATGVYTNIVIHRTPISVAGHDWYYFTSDQGSVRGTVLARREGDVFGSLRITHINDDELVHILNMFSGLTEELGQFTRLLQPETVMRTLGSWSGNVYTNEFYGLRINIPDDWEIVSEREMRELLGDTPMLRETMAVDLVDGDWIHLITEIVDEIMSEIQYLALLRDVLATMGHLDNFVLNDIPIRIGEKYWYYMTSHGVGGFMQSFFVNRNGKYMMNIRIIHDDYQDMFDILNMFSRLDGTLGFHTGLDRRIPGVGMK